MLHTLRTRLQAAERLSDYYSAAECPQWTLETHLREANQSRIDALRRQIGELEGGQTPSLTAPTHTPT